LQFMCRNGPEDRGRDHNTVCGIGWKEEIQAGSVMPARTGCQPKARSVRDGIHAEARAA
jgi:hypothetical protein